MTEWLKGCEICNAGLCARFDELIGRGLSQRRAARELEKEQQETLGAVVYSAQALRRRHQEIKSPGNGPKWATPTPETCTTSDLQTLIDSGKKFGTIYADPPWPYSNQATRAATQNHYQTMNLKDLAELPIKSLAADKAHLHLWTTNAFLFESKAIVEAWGFEYKSCFVWVKPQMGIGNYWRVSHEFLLLGVKGGLTFSDHSHLSWLCHERVGHSRKPEEFRRIIEKVSLSPYLELFGRRVIDGWTVWGDEIQRTIFHQNI
jgi:N6-adenosine-specific RNA methylase IME4